MDHDVESLTTMLDEAESLLRKHGIPHWAEWFSKDAKLIRNHDFHGVGHLLSAFGGMGSLNDLGLATPSKENPCILATSVDDARFQFLLSSMYSLAKGLAKSRPV